MRESKFYSVTIPSGPPPPIQLKLKPILFNLPNSNSNLIQSNPTRFNLIYSILFLSCPTPLTFDLRFELSITVNTHPIYICVCIYMYLYPVCICIYSNTPNTQTLEHPNARSLVLGVVSHENHGVYRGVLLLLGRGRGEVQKGLILLRFWLLC